jgi:hypothetical protein
MRGVSGAVLVMGVLMLSWNQVSRERRAQSWLKVGEGDFALEEAAGDPACFDESAVLEGFEGALDGGVVEPGGEGEGLWLEGLVENVLEGALLCVGVKLDVFGDLRHEFDHFEIEERGVPLEREGGGQAVVLEDELVGKERFGVEVEVGGRGLAEAR